MIITCSINIIINLCSIITKIIFSCNRTKALTSASVGMLGEILGHFLKQKTLKVSLIKVTFIQEMISIIIIGFISTSNDYVLCLWVMK
jgi:hypothetical protein